ncbi:MAG: pilus assembly protein PilM [Planctomycetota bacterium]
MASGIGIDIGNDSIKIVRVSVSRGKVAVTGAMKIPRNSPALGADATQPEKAGSDGKPEKKSGDAFFVPTALGALIKSAGFATTGTVGVTGREVNIRYLSVPPVPPDKLRMLLNMELAGKLTGGKIQDDVPAVTYDWRILNVSGGLKSDLTIMAGIAKNDFLLGAHALLKKASIAAETLTPSAFGLVNAYLSTQTPPPGETVVLCDVGHDLLEIAVIEDRSVLFARSAAGGGKKFNLSLDKVLQTGSERAAVFKHDRARIYPEGAEMRSKQDENFQPALREGADAIAAAIRSSIMFCRTQAKLPKLDFTRVYLSGGGARLKGLCDYLEKKLARPVQPLNVAAGVNLSGLRPDSALLFQDAISDMSVALGLAVIDADHKAVHFDFVPEPILNRRSFWRKTVVGIAAGVVLIAGLVPPYLYAQKAAAESASVVAKFDEFQKTADKDKKEYAKFVEQKRMQAAKADYYARQTRMDRVYVELLRVVRESTPKRVMLNYVGPPIGESSGTGLGSWKATDQPILDFVIRGSYDKEEYPEQAAPPRITINEAWNGKHDKDDKIIVEGMRDKLLKVPGVKEANLVALADTDPALGAKLDKEGKKPFQATIKLRDPATPLKAARESKEAKP